MPNRDWKSIWPSLYLWLAFGLFVLYKSVLLSEQYVSLLAPGVALFSALALGKIMLIAQELHFADRFKDKPLIYQTLFKSVASLVLGLFKIPEEASAADGRCQSWRMFVVGYKNCRKGPTRWDQAASLCSAPSTRS